MQESFIKTRNCAKKNENLFSSSNRDTFIPIRYTYYFKQNSQKIKL